MTYFITNVLVHTRLDVDQHCDTYLTYTLYNASKNTMSTFKEDELKELMLQKKIDIVNAKLVLKENASNSKSLYDVSRYEIKGKTGSFDKFLKKFKEYQKAHCEYAYMTNGLPEYYTVIKRLNRNGQELYVVVGSKNGKGVVDKEHLAEIITRGIVINAKIVGRSIVGINWTIPEQGVLKGRKTDKEDTKDTKESEGVSKLEKDKLEKARIMLEIRNLKSYEIATILERTLLTLLADGLIKDLKYTISTKNETEKDNDGNFKFDLENPYEKSYSKVKVELTKGNGSDDLTITVVYDFNTHVYFLNYFPVYFKTSRHLDITQLTDSLVASVKEFYEKE